MIANILTALGGIGLFLLGMSWLTEGLRGLAGRALRDALARYTRTPLSGVITGALTTAAIQSSSATTVTAIGFVSAGLLTFTQALGIIFGANIGTTLTGWLVTILGFKLQLGQIALPVIFIAALFRLFGTGRTAVYGTALAGFCLVFIGISAMQDGMAGFEGMVTPESFPDDTLIGRFQLLLIGVVITLVTQSSSAGVAMALAALGTGTINFPQAAALVIGMDVGTTFTAALATLGGSAAMRRTGLSHVIYNLMTGLMAFLLLQPFALLATPLIESGESQIALVAFHSSFNVLGVLLVLPFTSQFANFVMMVVPERGPYLSRHLDQRLLQDAAAANDAVLATVKTLVDAQFQVLANELASAGESKQASSDPTEIGDALSETRSFLNAIPPADAGSPLALKMTAMLHILDHLQRLHFRCNQAHRIEGIAGNHRLERLGRILRYETLLAIESQLPRKTAERLNRVRRLFRGQRRGYREYLLSSASVGQMDISAVPDTLDSLRWFHRVAYHMWRIEYHLATMVEDHIAADVQP